MAQNVWQAFVYADGLTNKDDNAHNLQERDFSNLCQFIMVQDRPFHLHAEYNRKQCLYIKRTGNTTVTYVNLVTWYKNWQHTTSH